MPVRAQVRKKAIQARGAHLWRELGARTNLNTCTPSSLPTHTNFLFFVLLSSPLLLLRFFSFSTFFLAFPFSTFCLAFDEQVANRVQLHTYTYGVSVRFEFRFRVVIYFLILTLYLQSLSQEEGMTATVFLFHINSL